MNIAVLFHNYFARERSTPSGYKISSDSDVGSFTSHKNKSVKVLRDGTYGFSSLSEKTRKSNHLQISLRRQHFLLSYLKTLSVGPARPLNPRPPARQTGALPTELTRRRLS